MQNYNYVDRLQEIWKKAVEAYAKGERAVDRFFTESESAFLASIGMKKQELFDFAEDYNNKAGVPDFTMMAMIQAVRRNYFYEVQKKQLSKSVFEATELPAKTDDLQGIVWLPRIMAKAKAKLTGTLPADVMYGCSGDQRFFRENDIHPAEFLQLIWNHWEDQDAIVAWIKARRS